MKAAVLHLLGECPAGSPVPVSGGCIHRAHRWGPYFIKSNDISHAPAFRSEATGLGAIAATGAIRTPEVVATGTADGTAILILEHLDLRPSGDESRLGEAMAALHQTTAPVFGFREDNFIGSTPQTNPPTASWGDFFADHRLARIFDLLGARKITFRGSERFLERVGSLLPKNPPASLLHGDLWSGNRAYLPDGEPVVFDPACYHGHAAADLAMTRLFGGFGHSFYEAYRSNHGDSGHADDLDDIYNLYHILNHALLFGGSYISQADAIIQRFS